jgi:hypothetical protein
VMVWVLGIATNGEEEEESEGGVVVLPAGGKKVVMKGGRKNRSVGILRKERTIGDGVGRWCPFLVVVSSHRRLSKKEGGRPKGKNRRG